MTRRIALVSMHTSPLATPGAGDAGGMNVYVKELAEHLVALDFDVEVLTRAESAETSGQAIRTSGGALVRFLTAGEAAPVAKERLPELTRAFGDAILRLPRFELIHSHYWLSGMATMPVAARLGIPHVQSLHTVAALKNARLADGDTPEPEIRIAGERELARSSAAVIASTRAERLAIAESYGVDAERIEVVAPGVDGTLFHPSWEKPGTSDPAPSLTDGRPYILVVGRIQPLKAQDVAIRALSLLPESERPLLLVAGETSGANDAYRTDLDRIIEQRRLAADVRLIGPVARDELAMLMRHALLLMVPSHSETYGLVTLEAAASGLPVIAARAAGLRESVAEGISGIFVDSHDERQWADALRGILADRRRLTALAHTAAAYGRSHSWSATARTTGAIYDRVLGISGTEPGE